MARHDTIGAHQTRVTRVGAVRLVTYHRTQVAVFNEKYIRLDTGGWRTATTKLRMNQTSNQFNLGYGVTQSKGEWYIIYRGHAHRYEGEVMFLDRDTGRVESTREDLTVTPEPSNIFDESFQDELFTREGGLCNQ